MPEEEKTRIVIAAHRLGIDLERAIRDRPASAGRSVADPGPRAVCVADPNTAERAIASNDAWIITFGRRITGPAVTQLPVDIWRGSDFQDRRSTPMVGEMDALDAEYRSMG